MSSSAKHILRSTAWVSVHTGLYRLITLLVAMLSARLLNVEDYGKISILQSTSALFIMFATMGMGTLATKLVAEKGASDVKAVSILNVVLCATAAVIIFLFRNLIATHIYQDSSLAHLFAWLSVYIFFCGVAQIQTGILAGKEAYHSISMINLWSGLVSVLLVAIGIFYCNVTGWILGLAASEAIKVLVFHRKIHQVFELKMRVSLADIRHIAVMALPIALSGFFVLPINWFLIRTLLLNTGYMDVALMNIADQWVAILTFLPIALGNAMLPVMSRMTADGDRAKVSSNAVKINVGLALVASIPVALLAEVILLLYGQAYTGNGYLFWAIIPLVTVLSVTNQLNNRVIADNKANAMLISNIIWMAICLPIGLLLIKGGLGVLGLLSGRLVGYIAKMCYLMFVSRQTAIR